MRTWVVCTLVAAVACSWAPTEPSSAAPPAATPPQPVERSVTPTPAPAPTPPVASTPAAEPGPEPDLCTSLCVQRRQMQATAIEVIESACRGDCAALARAPVDPACARAAAQARERSAKVGMSRRAPLVWKQMNAALACGNDDPVLARLAEIGAANAKTRESDLLEALAADPFFERLCPAGIDVAKQAAARGREGRTKHLVEACPLAGIEVDGAARDLPVGTLLAIETVALRWQAYGATSSDHGIMLDTLRLSSALAAAP